VSTDPACLLVSAAQIQTINPKFSLRNDIQGFHGQDLPNALDGNFLGFCSNVRNNNLTGPIPDGIGNCSSFQILYALFPHLYSILVVALSPMLHISHLG
jgi:hypothetical protein